MFCDMNELHGYISVYKIKPNGERLCLIDKHNTLTTTYYTALRDKLINRDTAGRGASIDGMTWGSFNASAGTNCFVDGTYAGTFNAGSNANLVMTSPTVQQAKFSGTFNFSDTRYFNYFELGQGYQAAGSAISQLITTRYAYDNSLLTGSTSLQYDNGDKMVVDWTLQIGA